MERLKIKAQPVQTQEQPIKETRPEITPEYFELIKNEVREHNQRRAGLKKVFRIDRQTPESRMMLEKNIKETTLKKVQNIKDETDQTPYTVEDILKLKKEKVIKNPSWFIFGDYVEKLTEHDTAMIKRVLSSSEIQATILKKCEYPIFLKGKIQGYDARLLNNYLEAAGDSFPPSMAKVLSITYASHAQDAIKELSAFPGFKTWFNNKENQELLINSKNCYGIIKAYMEAPKKVIDEKRDDPFFMSTTERDDFFLMAVKKHDWMFDDNYLNFLEELGLLDNPETYRNFIQTASNTNTIAGVYNRKIAELKKKHKAAETLIQPEELRHASLSVLNWISNKELENPIFRFDQQSDISKAIFDRYHEIFNQITKINDLFTESESGRERTAFSLSKATAGINSYALMSENTERPEDVQKARETSKNIFMLGQDRLDAQWVKKEWDNGTSGQDFNIFETLPLLKSAAKTSGSADFEKIVLEYLKKTIQSGSELIHESISRLGDKSFVDQLSFLTRNLPAEYPLQKSMLEEITLIYKAEECHSGYYAEKYYNPIYHIKKFTSLSECLDAMNFLREYGNSEKIQKIYYTLRERLGHQETKQKMNDAIKDMDRIDPRLLGQPWIVEAVLNDEIRFFIKQIYSRYGQEKSPGYIDQCFKIKEADPEIFNDKETINFFSKMAEYGLPIDISLRKNYADSVRTNKEKEWIKELKDIAERMNNVSPLNEQERSSRDYLAMVKTVYPPSDYSAYEENLKLKDKNEHLKNLKFNPEGYKMKLSGVVGYERTAPEQPGLLMSYQKRIEKIRAIAQDPELVFKRISELIAKSQVNPLYEEPKNDLEFGANLLALFNDYQFRKKNSIEAAFSDEELSDLAIAYHLRGEGEEFVRGTEDERSTAADQTTRDYIEWDALSRIYVEDGKQTLMDLYENLQKTEQGKSLIQSLAKRYQGANLITTEEIQERMKSVSEELEATLTKAQDQSKHRTIVVKKLQQLANAFFQNQFKPLSLAERNDAKESILRLIEEKIVPQNGNLLERINDPESARALNGMAQSFSFHPLKAVNKTMETDTVTIKKEVAAYEVKIEKEKRKDRVEEKKIKPREIIGYFSKTAEVANARGTARICIAKDTKMWDNPNYFELVLFNKEAKQCEGTVMLLTIEEAGKKYLLYCPNPSERLISQVSFEDAYRKITKIISDFADANGYDSVIASATVEGRSTNRTGGFASAMKKSFLKDTSGDTSVLKLNKKYPLGGGYEYGGDETLHYAWRK